MNEPFDPIGVHPDGAHRIDSLSLREEKKEMTRRALVDVAMERFLENGYEETTLEEVAREVRVSLRTLLRYFDSKEHLFHAWHHRALAAFSRALAAKPEHQTVLFFWRTWTGRYSTFAAGSEALIRHRAVHESVPALHAHWLMILRHYEDLLTDALVAEVGESSRLPSRLAAIALVGGSEAVTREWMASDGSGDLQSACLEVADLTERLFSKVGISYHQPTPGPDGNGDGPPADPLGSSAD